MQRPEDLEYSQAEVTFPVEDRKEIFYVYPEMVNQDQPAGRRPSRLAAALQNAVTSLHSVLYRSSNGVIGGKIANSPVLLLTTTGPRGCKSRSVPLLCF